MLKQLTAIAALCCAAAHGQAVPPVTPVAAADFPAGAQVPSAAQLAERLNGNVFTARVADGMTWRMDYKSSSGYVFFDVSNGARDTAKWRTEDGKACYEFRGRFPSGCTDFRLAGDKLYFQRRSTGEVLALEK